MNLNDSFVLGDMDAGLFHLLLALTDSETDKQINISTISDGAR